MNESSVWSNTDFPYMCLRDSKRTLAFRDAINAAVRSGDTVVDVGSGSGILALFAARAGAKKVYAVEIDPILANSLRRTASRNGLEHVIEVIEGDALQVELPRDVDVVVAELIETGLIDEQQVPVINRLVESGTIGPDTSVIPSAYATFLEVVHADHLYYGELITAPAHDWPFLSDSIANTWTPTAFDRISLPHKVMHVDLSRKNDVKVDCAFTLYLDDPRTISAIRLSGILSLNNEDLELGATNTMNGDKVFYMDELAHGGQCEISLAYEMGGGLHTLSFTCRV